MYEYILLAGINDRPEDARNLADALEHKECVINLDPRQSGAGKSSNGPVTGSGPVLPDAEETAAERDGPERNGKGHQCGLRPAAGQCIKGGTESMIAVSRTNRGMVRPNNEDSILVREPDLYAMLTAWAEQMREKWPVMKPCTS